MGLETGWNFHISLTPCRDSSCDGARPAPVRTCCTKTSAQQLMCWLCDEAESPLLLKEEVLSDLEILWSDEFCFSTFPAPSQAQLPGVIHQGHPHLKSNVPLLVPLLTDCSPRPRQWSFLEASVHRIQSNSCYCFLLWSALP